MDPDVQKQIEDAIKAITTAIKIMDEATDPAKKEAARKVVQRAIAALRTLVGQLVKAGQGPNARGVLAKALQQLGINVGKAQAAEAGAEAAGSLIAKLAGSFASAIVIILTNPTPISGIDRKLVDEFILNVGDRCFRLRWVKTKGSDELIWSDPRLEWEEVDCPEEEPVQP
jgi:hypothetical protein